MRFSYPEDLPICSHKEEIIKALHTNQVLVVAGDTGSGKTTQLPKMCLEALGEGENLVGCTQPRRIATISVADRVAEEMAAPDKVGYKIRFQDRVPNKALIKFMTDGVLLAETKSDPLLKKYQVLIIDEAHERSLNIDFLLGYIKSLLSKRPDLKLVISSATIDTEKFSEHFHNAPIINVSGTLFPIQTVYEDNLVLSDEDDPKYVDAAVQVVEQLCNQPHGGDILVFMPTERDILDTIDQLTGNPSLKHCLFLPLFGRLQTADQKKVFYPSNKRKVIVATNVAETSITVPGISFVVDTGLARIARYNPRSGTTNLQISRVSKASCDQRKGRCGRTGPGTCIRLYAEEDYNQRDEFTLPEIQRSNLAEVILQMVSLQLGEPEHFPFVDPPSPRSVHEGYRTLKELGAINADGNLTQNGRLMATLPLDPCISRIILESANRNALREITVIAAALSIQDPRVRPLDLEFKADEAHRQFADKQSDFLSLLNIWDTLYQQGDKISWSRLSKFCKQHFLSWQRMREWFDVHDQLKTILKYRGNFEFNKQPADYAGIHISLTSGFLRNICHKKEKNTYLSAGQKEVVLFPGSNLYNKGSQWVVASSFVETTQLFARTVARIDPAWLESLGGDLCKYSWTGPHWEKKKGQVIATERVTLFGLPIVAGRNVNYGRINKQRAQEAKHIFIQEALIGDNLGGNYGFMEHNRNLLDHFQKMEERVRRRDILVDEQLLHAFYEKRLGLVYDRFTLNRLLRRKKNDSFLHLQQKDICLNAPGEDELYRFPEKLSVGSLAVPLYYHFEPGQEQDGVTVLLPAQSVAQIDPQIFEWLVPGLLPEKLLFLLKRLPKQQRKKLVPLPDAVDRLLDGLDLYKGSLYSEIEKILLRFYQIQVHRTDWQPEALPPHLKMRFAVVDEQGETIHTSRSFEDVQQKAHTSSRPMGLPSKADKLPDKHDISLAELQDFASVLVQKSKRSGMEELFYATLQFDSVKQTIRFHYLNNLEASRQQTAEALLFLIEQHLAKETKQLKKESKHLVATNSASWLALGNRLSASHLQQQVYRYVLRQVVPVELHEIPSAEQFTATLENIRAKGIGRLAQSHFSDIIQALQKRKSVIKSINEWKERARKNKSFEQKRLEEYQQTLELILPEGFLERSDILPLKEVPRYLQGLITRIERAEFSPAKDQKKAERLAKDENRLRQLETFSVPSTVCKHHILQYRQMVEEFRISVFAPELGTRISVSEKKLTAYWKDLEDSCRRVE
ncbi:ATP-dependent RNA helicase HrpA [Desulfogranum japonicum]|uniref:ATP-dependent RNA helicase HrpA n=1 Tax=Desulfogranum japonicum TaxID=231447 RepID=UPI000414232B|nr:ATP-dependent RNA helicase HrpA [Desulfogranum japonicum]